MIGVLSSFSPIEDMVLRLSSLAASPLPIGGRIGLVRPEAPNYRSFAFFDKRARCALRELRQNSVLVSDEILVE